MARLVSTAILALCLGLIGGYVPVRCATDRSKSIEAGDAGERVREALLEHDRIERLAELAALFPRIRPQGLDAVLDAYRHAPLNGGDIEFVPLVAWWTRFDAEAARRWTQRDRRARYRRVVEALFREWGRSDPQRALAELPTLRGSLLRRLSTIAVLIGSDEAGRQPDEIAALLRALPEGPDRRAAIRALVRRRLAANDVRSSVRWAETLSGRADGLARDVAMGSASALVDRSPELAADFLSAHLAPDAELPEEVPREIGEAWVARDPAAAMSWLASLPEGRARDEAVRFSYLAWQGRDDPAARAWIAARQGSRDAPMERALEPALDVYARLLARDDTRAALDLAQRLSQETARERAVVAILAYWSSQDRNAAEAWMEAADVTANQRQAVRRAAAQREAHRRLPVRARPVPPAESEAATGTTPEGARP